MMEGCTYRPEVEIQEQWYGAVRPSLANVDTHTLMVLRYGIPNLNARLSQDTWKVKEEGDRVIGIDQHRLVRRDQEAWVQYLW